MLSAVPSQVTAKVEKDEPGPMPVAVRNENSFVLKRGWAKKAESDDGAVYDGFRRTKCFETITDLEKWTKENVQCY